MEIWLVRHGETFGNQDEILQGHLGGKLTKKGEQQAQVVKNKLAAVNFDSVYCSDSLRAQETAKIVLNGTGISDVHMTPLLREKGGGELEGKKLSLYREKARKSDLHPREYKSELGESWNDVHNRALQLIENLTKTYIEGEESKLLSTNINSSVDSELKKQGFGKPKRRSPLRDGKNTLCFKKVNKETQRILDLFKPFETKNPDFKRVLLFTHGGLIMELNNVMNRLNGKKTHHDNNAKNCSMYVYGIEKVNREEDLDDQISGTSMLPLRDLDMYRSERLLTNHRFKDEFGLTTTCLLDVGYKCQQKAKKPIECKTEKKSLKSSPSSMSNYSSSVSNQDRRCLFRPRVRGKSNLHEISKLCKPIVKYIKF